MTLLVTGFGPFLDVAVNPSGLIATRLDGVRLGGDDPRQPVITAEVLPVSFKGAAAALGKAMARVRPTTTLLIGVARGPDYRLETGAGEQVTSVHPDATGRPHAGLTLGASPLRTTRDVPALVASLRAAGHDAVSSDDCGGYVCNSTYFSALAATPDALFLHIPPATDEGALERGTALVLSLLALLSAPGAKGTLPDE